uniref:Uncharacterized protein n=1 Tax=Arion vulgaris TaxID=1028688 RepID=A0A0B6Z1Y0_9EUPU
MWRSNNRRGTRVAENRRTVKAQRKRAAQKDRTPTYPILIMYAMTCGRGLCFYSDIRTQQ